MRRLATLVLVAMLAGCGGSSLTANQKLVQTTEVTLQASAAAMGAWDLDHQHAVLAATVARGGTLADFQAQIKTYRDGRTLAVQALQASLAAASDAAKHPTEATLATLAIAAANFYNRVSELGLALKKGGQ